MIRRLDNNPFFQTRVQTATDRQLAVLGFEKVASAPDLLLHYHASVGQELEHRRGRSSHTHPAMTAPAPTAWPTTYDAGTILLDIVDTRSNTLIWRGWAANEHW